MTSKSKRFAVLERDKSTCQYCGARAPSVELQIDHIIPKRLGGTDELSNLTTSCVDCNQGKSGRPLSEHLYLNACNMFDNCNFVPGMDSNLDIRNLVDESIAKIYIYKQLRELHGSKNDVNYDELGDWVENFSDNPFDAFCMIVGYLWIRRSAHISEVVERQFPSVGGE